LNDEGLPYKALCHLRLRAAVGPSPEPCGEPAPVSDQHAIGDRDRGVGLQAKFTTAFAHVETGDEGFLPRFGEGVELCVEGLPGGRGAGVAEADVPGRFGAGADRPGQLGSTPTLLAYGGVGTLRGLASWGRRKRAEW